MIHTPFQKTNNKPIETIKQEMSVMHNCDCMCHASKNIVCWGCQCNNNEVVNTLDQRLNKLESQVKDIFVVLDNIKS